MVRRPVGIQVLTPEDWRVWRELRLAALTEAPDAFGSRLEDWADAGEERWRDRLSMPGSHNLVARLDDAPVGMASGIPGQSPQVAELISMWVSPEARGRGVGDVLIEEVTGWAAGRGARVLELAVVKGNGAAIGLYRRHGFEDIGGAEGERMMAKPLPVARR
ncbi:MAG: GNAT family N-acetyltransferase [Nonomuraea sp.]|nr:GNAT family N-acetyltransferase [Nonomuraea sp.]